MPLGREDLIAQACGIVLAGGRSHRFGRDKLSEPLGGRALVRHAIEALTDVCDEVLVAVAPLDDSGVPLPPHVRVVRDAEAHGGPLMGLLTAARATSRELLLVVAGDMPFMVPDVLRMQLQALAGGHEAAVLGRADQDALQPLPLALRRAALLRAAEQPAYEEQPSRRSLRALLEGLDAVVIPEAEWRLRDPEGLTTRDVDRPEDLPAPGS